MDLPGESTIQLLLLIILGLSYAVYRVYKFSADVHCKSVGNLKVPDGRFWQLPFIGETFEFFASNVDDFLRRHTSKYGETFTTVLFGEPMIVTTSIEAASFAVGSPHSLETFHTCFSNTLWGKDCLPLMKAGFRRLQFRKLFLQGPLGLENFRKFCPTVSHIAIKCLRSPAWNKSGIVIVKDNLCNYMFHVSLKFFLGIDDINPKLEEIREWYTEVEDGDFVPRFWNLPGTRYQKALKARKHLCEFAEKLIEERSTSSGHQENEEKDMLDVMMEAEILDEADFGKSTRKLRETEIRDNLVLALFASHKTPAFVLTWVIRMLAVHPHVLEKVQEEQDEIAKQLKLERRIALSFEDTRKMQYTWKVVQETMRMYAPAALVPRRATKDLEFQGRLIPKGWRLLVFLKSFMMDPKYHSDPERFNPSRFDAPMAPRAFQPYGSGPRMCPGIEYSRLEILVFLHHFVTTRSWSVEESKEGIKQWPIPVPAKGCPILLYPRGQQYL